MCFNTGGFGGRPSVAVAVLATTWWGGPAWASSFGYAGLAQLILALLIGGGVVLVLGTISAFWSSRIFFWVSLFVTVPVLCFAIYFAAAIGGEPFFLIPVSGSALGLVGLVIHTVRFRRRPAAPIAEGPAEHRETDHDASEPPA